MRTNTVLISRMYEYRIYPFKNQQRILNRQLDLACDMYNSLLGLKQEIWKETEKSLTKIDLDNIITELKADNPNWKDIHSQVLQNVSDRLSKAFDNFFRRVREKKSGKRVKVGYPRFKKQHRYKSITFPQSGFKFVSDKKLCISKVGDVPIVLSRVPKGEVKTMTVKIKNGKWYVCFSCILEQKIPKHPHKDKEIGIDVGLTKFAYLSNDIIIQKERFYKQKEKRIKRLQRRLSRKKKGSHSRCKARLILAIEHEKVADRRHDFQHRASRYIADTYGQIGVEGLNINGMLKNRHLAKHIADAGWRGFLQKTCYKAVSAGGMFVVGDRWSPSTKECNDCHAIIDMTLADRIFNCPVCGAKIDRDYKASIHRKPSNIKKRDKQYKEYNAQHQNGIIRKNRAGHVRIYACGDSASTLRTKCNASGVVEAKNHPSM